MTFPNLGWLPLVIGWDYIERETATSHNALVNLSSIVAQRSNVQHSCPASMLDLRFVNISAGQITSSQLALQHSSFVFPFLDGFLNIPVGQEVKFLQLIAGGGGRGGPISSKSKGFGKNGGGAGAGGGAGGGGGGGAGGGMGLQHSSFVFPMTLDKSLSVPVGQLKLLHNDGGFERIENVIAPPPTNIIKQNIVINILILVLICIKY